VKDVNVPKDQDGRMYHIGVKKGEVANRILTVGDPARALRYSLLLDEICFQVESNRGFNTYTGLKDNVPITIMSIGMGLPMMDFMVREAIQVVEGNMCIIRVGTCGTPNSEIPVGTVVIARDSTCCTTNYDAFHENNHNGNHDNSQRDYYNFTSTLTVNEELINNIQNNLNTGGVDNVIGSDITSDSFYGSQGRVINYFEDHNETLIDNILEKYPSTCSIQMETFKLYHLSKICTKNIDCAGVAIVLAQRKSNQFLTNEKKHEIETETGKAIIQTLAQWKIEGELNDDDCVWNKEK